MSKPLTPPIVGVRKKLMCNNTYSDGTFVWDIPTVIEYAKDLPVFDMPLAGIDIGREVWDNIVYIDQFVYHYKACLTVDMSYPIILTATGFIMDGWHRVVRAIAEERTTIKAVRFTEDPPYSHKQEQVAK